MLRACFALMLLAGGCLFLVSPETALAQKGGNSGTIKKVDPKSGAITFSMQVPIKGMKKKTELGEKELLLDDDAKVTVLDGGQKKTMTGKEALAAGVIKEGATATFVPDGSFKIKELNVGDMAKK
jgi:hypothetical protein